MFSINDTAVTRWDVQLLGWAEEQAPSLVEMLNPREDQQYAAYHHLQAQKLSDGPPHRLRLFG
jgi:hypothetical protein